MLKKTALAIPVVLLLTLTIASPALSASASFLQRATEHYNRNCKTNPTTLSRQTSMECYLFGKVGELNQSLTVLTNRVSQTETTNSEQNNKITSIESTLTPMPSKIADLQKTITEQGETITSLQTKITQLENSNSSFEEIIVFPYGHKTAGMESEIIDTKNHSVMSLYGNWQSGNGGYQILYSDDKKNWQQQPKAAGIQEGIKFSGNDYNLQDIQVTFAIKGKYYKLVVPTPQNVFNGAVGGYMY